MTGPRLAYVALVATVFGPFRPFNTKTFQNFISDAGDRGCFFLFDLQQKPGSLASTLEVRGLLEQEPDIAAKQELVVVCVSDSIMNIGYQAPSETPVLTEIQPVIGA